MRIYQRGVQIDTERPPMEIDGATVYPVVEDGNFSHPVSPQPVVVGKTDAAGRFLLPNRPVQEVRTLNGYHRRPNPFGNMDVVGDRALLLVEVRKEERWAYFWLELTDFVVAWHRGQRDRFVQTLRTTFPSLDSPPPPASVHAEPLPEAGRVRVAWDPPERTRETHPYDRIVGYRIFRRISNLGENERPWFPVATVGPQERTIVLDLRQRPEDLYYYDQDERIGVATIGELGTLSGLVWLVFTP
ncbi:MAG: hypothetical protein KatS3mg115_0748 [Candidatus Poribacteria bacterium]|nr:MAG: hypothetical protein KatS3mg115_0748 [Candidatus Poribacteria bacterium]